MSRIPLLLLLLAAFAVPVRAQQGGIVRPGMTVEQVRGVFGAPATTRRAGEWTYLFFRNGCPIRCGSDDVVFLRDGRVVAAVLHAPGRRFAGPAASDAFPTLDASSRAAPAENTSPGRVRGIRVEGSGNTAAGRGGAIIIRESPQAVPAATAPDTLVVDSAMNQSRQEREQRVEPRTIPSDANPARADTALDRERQRRERRVTPRTIRPRR